MISDPKVPIAKKRVAEEIRKSGIRTKPKTPVSASRKFDPEDDGPFTDEEKKLMEKIPYRSLLQRICQLWTRPDVGYLTHMASRFQVSPSFTLFIDLLRCVLYLKETKDLRLEYHKSNDGVELRGLSDASWATDMVGSRSLTGGLIQFCGNTIAAIIKKQSLISRSSCEAEWIACHTVARDLEYFLEMLQFLGWTQLRDFTLYTDSSSSIDMSKNLPGSKKKSRHFRLRVNDCREMIADGKMKFKFVRTKTNCSDFFTKPLDPKDYLKHRDVIMGQKRLGKINRDGLEDRQIVLHVREQRDHYYRMIKGLNKMWREDENVRRSCGFESCNNLQEIKFPWGRGKLYYEGKRNYNLLKLFEE